MKLEPELIKEILLWCEKYLPAENKSFNLDEMEISKFSRFQIVFHTKILVENDYIDAIDTTAGSQLFDCIFEHLTNNGYQYLNLIRSKAWNTAKGLLHETGVIFAEAAIKAVIDKYNPIV
ncbi:MAG: hypothetical protein C0410_01865 [Anaerolinea sp.]|nr:hypothetical protein [Anaerolinea sp.]